MKAIDHGCICVFAMFLGVVGSGDLHRKPDSSRLQEQMACRSTLGGGIFSS